MEVKYSPKELIAFNFANHLFPKRKLDDYGKFTSAKTLSRIRKAAGSIKGKKILRINATPFGGGVAEMIPYFASLLRDLRIEVDWLTMASPFGRRRGFNPPSKFFGFTSGLHYSLQDCKRNQSVFEKKDGQIVKRPARKTDRELFLTYNDEFAEMILAYQKKMGKADLVICDDPQCLPVIKKARQKKQTWIWRFHPYGDPQSKSWKWLEPFILKYDQVVVTTPEYLPKKITKAMPIKQNFPFIDPFHQKLRPMAIKKITKVFQEFGISPQKPILAQISRYDPDKDPLGIIEVFRLLKNKYPTLQMVYVGNFATDNPVSLLILKKMKKRIKGLKSSFKKDIFLLHSAMKHPRPVGFFYQELAAIWNYPKSYLIQLSSREGFGLVVSEAAWCGKPIVASRIGGITPQIIDQKTGFLVKPGDYQKVANLVSRLISNPDLAKKPGEEAKEHVRKNFLITSNLLRWLEIFNSSLS